MNNRVKIAAGINVFNDRCSLQRTLQTTIEYFDRIYVIDGRYPDYNDKTNQRYSTDGTQDLVEAFSNCVYIPYYAEQKDKRTRYLKESEYDFLLVIDADEYMITSSWSGFQDSLQRNILNMPSRSRCYQYQINYESEPNKFIALPRLVYKPTALTYQTHWILTGPDNKTVEASSQMIEGITICTDDLLRPYTRIEHDIDYQWDLFLKEKVITQRVHDDTECKTNFAKHIIWEVSVWRDHVDKIKPVSRFKRKS